MNKFIIVIIVDLLKYFHILISVLSMWGMGMGDTTRRSKMYSHSLINTYNFFNSDSDES